MPVYCDQLCLICGHSHRVVYCLLPIRPLPLTRPTVKSVDAYLVWLAMVTGDLRPEYRGRLSA